ncbi:HAD family hydrolase [Burkholderia latens]|uniref:HAD family hydrolase n=1 Tax=Burkholderia latens TaxID=488446 RepID=UPI001588F81D|nr:HAD-IA family hydrolase [Burkholderia latens]
MSKILVMDIGGVLIFNDNHRLLKRLASRMSRPPSEERLLAAIRQSGIGTGVSTLRNLQDLLIRDFAWRGTEADLLSDWTCHFAPNVPMLETLRPVASRQVIVLCSNTNREHWLALRERYSLDSICTGAILSFEVGVEKPHKKIYRHVKNLYPDKKSDAFLFVDDNVENVLSAANFGFSVHHYGDHDTFLTAFEHWASA